MAAGHYGGPERVTVEKTLVKHVCKGQRRRVADRPIGAEIVCDAAAQERFGEAYAAANAVIGRQLRVDPRLGGAAPNSAGLACIEKSEAGQARKIQQVGARQNFSPCADDAALGRIDGIKEGVPGVMEDVELTRRETPGNFVLARFVADQFRHAHRGFELF